MLNKTENYLVLLDN